jgi:hypothetical protein
MIDRKTVSMIDSILESNYEANKQPAKKNEPSEAERYLLSKMPVQERIKMLNKMEDAKRKIAKGDAKMDGWVNPTVAKRYTESVISNVDIQTAISSVPAPKIKTVDIRFDGNQAYIK